MTAAAAAAAATESLAADWIHVTNSSTDAALVSDYLSCESAADYSAAGIEGRSRQLIEL